MAIIAVGGADIVMPAAGVESVSIGSSVLGGGLRSIAGTARITVGWTGAIIAVTDVMRGIGAANR